MENVFSFDGNDLHCLLRYIGVLEILSYNFERIVMDGEDVKMDEVRQLQKTMRPDVFEEWLAVGRAWADAFPKKQSHLRLVKDSRSGTNG